jgi:probable selenium-dependent hydroxylase accessory protein YqeC
MNIYEALEPQARGVLSLVGGGGKTTVMFRLAEEIPSSYRVLVTTTTKIHLPPREKFPCFYIDNEGHGEALTGVIQSGIRPVVARERIEDNKLKGIEPEQLPLLLEKYAVDFILVEADGSRGRSLKGHTAHEPVVPNSTTQLIVVIGADVLGKRLDADHVHRPEIVADLTGQPQGSLIKPDTVASLIKHRWGILRSSPPAAEIIVMINKIDCLKSLRDVHRIAALILSDRIRKVVLCSAYDENPVREIIYCH